MAILSYAEKRSLEDFFEMGGGYVLDFSNRTFQEFVFDSTGLDVEDESVAGLGSKANRLRNFWRIQPDHIVGKLTKDLVAHRQSGSGHLRAKCDEIADRLPHAAPVDAAEVLSVLSERAEFERLAKGVLESINRNDPESGLDRLHTVTVKFIRSLCEKHGIATPRDKPLHSIFGEYVKKLKELNRIESSMTERILKSTISVLEAFSDVRNERSLAHDNKVLNRNESLLILNHITGSIRFIWALEQIKSGRHRAAAAPDDGDFSF